MQESSAAERDAIRNGVRSLGSLILFLLRVYVVFMAGFFLYCLIVVPSSGQQLSRVRSGRGRRRTAPFGNGADRREREEPDPWVRYLREGPARRLADQLPVDAETWQQDTPNDSCERREGDPPQVQGGPC